MSSVPAKVPARILVCYTSVLMLLVVLTGCAETRLAAHMIKSIDDAVPSDGDGDFKVGTPYTIAGKTYYPRERYNYTQTGVASWYGHKFHGKATANGERFSRFELTAAHKTLQLPSLVQVTNLENGRSLVVRVNDRGPFKRGRIIDMSERGAELLGFKKQGTARVRLDVLEKPSRRIAAAAKRGESTSGSAIAANKALQRQDRLAQRGASTPSRPERASAQPAQKKTKGQQKPTQLAKAETQKSKQSEQSQQPQRLSYERPGREVRQQRLRPRQSQSQSQARAQNEKQVATKGADQQGNIVQETADVPTANADDLVTKQDVAPTALYVQAGSFTKQDNAKQLALKLRRVAKTDIAKARVDSRNFYRVRLGPLDNVERADEVLNRVIALGHNNAMIVVDEGRKEQS